MSQQTDWRKYEKVAEYLLGQIGTHFGLGRVEGKQLVAGASATWEIDAKGVLENDQGFLIIECRRHTTRGLSQEQIAALAFRIQDTGAVGGIIVSPWPLQSGARAVANSKHIHEVRLSPDCSTTDYVAQFLQNIFIGMSEKLAVHDFLDATILRASEQK